MNIRKAVIQVIISIPLLLSAAVVYAAPTPPPAAPLPATADMYSNPIAYVDSYGTAVDSVPRFLLALVDLIFLIAVPVIVICIIYSGFLFVTAGDNEAQIGKARTVFTWTVIGAGVLLGAKAIELAVQNTICALKDPTGPTYFCP